MAKIFFESIHTKSRFEVVSFNQEAGTITMLGRHGVPFDVKYSKEHFEEMGYRPVKDDAEAQALPPPPPPPAPPAPSTSTVPPPPVSQPATA